KSVMTGAERGGLALRVAGSQQSIQCTGIEEWKVAREHEPRSLRVQSLCSGDSGDRSKILVRVGDSRIASADRVRALVRPDGNESLFDKRLDERHGPV